jgi:hypothetical protein
MTSSAEPPEKGVNAGPEDQEDQEGENRERDEAEHDPGPR